MHINEEGGILLSELINDLS